MLYEHPLVHNQRGQATKGKREKIWQFSLKQNQHRNSEWTYSVKTRYSAIGRKAYGATPGTFQLYSEEGR